MTALGAGVLASLPEFLQSVPGVALLVAGFLAFVFAVVVLRYGALWVRAWMSGAHVTFLDLIGMTFRAVPSRVIVESRIKAMQAGLEVSSSDMQSYYMQGGDVPTVVEAVIRAKNAGMDLNWRNACEIARTKRDLLGAVATSIRPRIIDIPSPDSGKGSIDAVAMDGIQVRAKARVTVRMRLDRLIGGALEETIVARVGEGIVSAIGSAKTYKTVLENPDTISKAVLSKGLDSGTAFDIVSIDIADVDIGRNIGAELQINQAEADKQVAQANAEKRAAIARAVEQEMKAQVKENRAKVVLAEAEVPLAIANSFKSGNLGSLR